MTCCTSTHESTFISSVFNRFQMGWSVEGFFSPLSWISVQLPFPNVSVAFEQSRCIHNLFKDLKILLNQIYLILHESVQDDLGGFL